MLSYIDRTRRARGGGSRVAVVHRRMLSLLLFLYRALTAEATVRVVTVVGGEETGYFQALHETAARYNYTVHVVRDRWRGFGWRLRTSLKYACDQAPGDVVVSVDAFDVTFNRPADTISVPPNTFLVGATRTTLTKEAEFGPNKCPPPYACLCAGVWLTTPAVACSLLSDYAEALAVDDLDDQRWLNGLVDERVVVDCNASTIGGLFRRDVYNQNWADADPADHLYVDENKTIVLGAAKTAPPVLHWSGDMIAGPLLKASGVAAYRTQVSKAALLKKEAYHWKAFPLGVQRVTHVFTDHFTTFLLWKNAEWILD